MLEGTCTTSAAQNYSLTILLSRRFIRTRFCPMALKTSLRTPYNLLRANRVFSRWRTPEEKKNNGKLGDRHLQFDWLQGETDHGSPKKGDSCIHESHSFHSLNNPMGLLRRPADRHVQPYAAWNIPTCRRTTVDCVATFSRNLFQGCCWQGDDIDGTGRDHE